MKLKIFSIHDSAAKVYARPFLFSTSAEAMRMFETQVNDKEKGGLIAAHPDQFTLYQIGEYDDTTGKLTSGEVCMSLGNGINFVKDDLPKTEGYRELLRKIDIIQEKLSKE